MPILVLIACLLASMGFLQAEAPTVSVEELIDSGLESVVVIYQDGRRGEKGASGTGFIIEDSGLIATNWHVINDRRRIRVELRDGSQHEVTEVHAWDRKMDLALIRIETERELPALSLGDSDSLVQGQPVVALGNPQGLKFSVVEGIVSGLREEIGDAPFPLIQIAMPVEAGNSGGPLLDRSGKVQGIITLKSMVTRNLGFAVPINGLQILLNKPNSMPMERWATIGALDPRRWETIMGANWSQRAGRIQVNGLGDGFGGRSLCLSREELPGDSYELEVDVKLDDERGAAGLAFASDGGDLHYGFYPSGGNLRLTRFQGADVLSWEILEQLDVPNYIDGDWNRIRVKVAPDGIRCFVNDAEVAISDDSVLRGGQVGLCKFRGTAAEFRNFRVAKKLIRNSPDAAVQSEFTELVEAFLKGDSSSRDTVISSLTKRPLEGRASLSELQANLELRIADLKRLARDTNSAVIGEELAQALEGEEHEVDLIHCALLIAKLENNELDVTSYRELIADMALEIEEVLEPEASEEEIVERVREFMFLQNGFHGSRLDYANASNSFLNEVIDDREGIPITLSVVFIELAHRAGAQSVHGVGLPGHFVVGYHDEESGDQKLLDVFEGATPLTPTDTIRVVARSGRQLQDAMLEPVTKRAIVARMLRNLIELRKQEGEPIKAMPYISVMLKIEPEDVAARLDRAILRIQEGDTEGGKTDFRWLLQTEPPGVDVYRLRQFYETL
ncbi:MAG: transglutaminase family protein [Verrucomicrobiota bacterium]